MLVLALFHRSSGAQTVDDAAVKTRIQEIVKSYTPGNAFMGTVLVVEGDKVLLDQGYGMASLEWSIPNVPEAKFRLGSLTKQFTATLILLLQQDGKLQISDPVSKYLPDCPKAWEKITIANLLGHSSGIPNFTNDKGFEAWAQNPRTTTELLAFFKDKPLDFEPGTTFVNSNSNYEVLGAIIEKVSGKKYGEMLRERIFDPLGMKDTGLDADELVLPKRAQGYMPGTSGLIVARSESMTVPWAAGSIYSTTGDLIKWEQGLFGGKVLSEASLKAMTTAGRGNYGLGVGVRDRDGLKVIEHGGSIEGFNTFLSYAPERKIAIAVLSNVNGAAPDQMASQLLDVVLGKTVTLASERKAVPIAKEELGKFVGMYELTPTFSMTFAIDGDVLTGQGTSQSALPMMYQGVIDGDPRFYIAQVGAEIEFIADAGGAYSSCIVHQGGQNIPAKRK